MKNETNENQKSFSGKIGRKERLKILSGKNKKSIWTGFGVFGMVGWSVAVPTLSGVALGIWLDKKYKQSFSWTLSLLVVGLIIGCLIAWTWIRKENRDLNKNNEYENE